MLVAQATFYAIMTVVLSGLPSSPSNLTPHINKTYNGNRLCIVAEPQEGYSLQVYAIDAFATAQTEPATCDGGCHDMTDQAFQSPPTEPAGDCEWRVPRTWTDGCQGYYVYNPCNGAYEVDSNGDPIFKWVCCAE